MNKYIDELISITDEQKAMQLIQSFQLSRTQSSFLEKLWCKEHRRKRKTIGLQKEIFKIKDETTAMQMIDSSSYAQPTKGWLKWQWRKQQKSVPVITEISFIEYLQERKKNIMDELSKIDLMLSTTLLSKTTNFVSTKHDLPADIDDRCMICKQDAEGYDLKCGHPICYKCFRKQNCRFTCKLCGSFDSYDNYDADFDLKIENHGNKFI